MLEVSSPRGGAADQVGGHDLEKALNELIDQHVAAHRTSICLKVIELDSGEILFDRRGDQLMTPASNLKIYTSACALDTFGPKPSISRQRSDWEGELRDGTLAGDILLVGGGAPMTTSDDLRRMTKESVANFGLKKVLGHGTGRQFSLRVTKEGPGLDVG